MGTVRSTRGSEGRPAPSDRVHRTLNDVRDPAHPDLRVEQIRVCPSGIHVVTFVADGATPLPGSPVVDRARAAADVVATLLPPRYRDRVQPVLCRTDPAEVVSLVEDILVTSPGPFEHILRSSRLVLSTSEVNEIGLRLGALLEAYPLSPVDRDRHRAWHRVVAATVAAAGLATLALARFPEFAPLW